MLSECAYVRHNGSQCVRHSLRTNVNGGEGQSRVTGDDMTGAVTGERCLSADVVGQRVMYWCRYPPIMTQPSDLVSLDRGPQAQAVWSVYFTA